MQKKLGGPINLARMKLREADQNVAVASLKTQEEG